MFEHVHQVFRAAEFRIGVIFARERGKHARHRNGCLRATARCIGKGNNVALLQVRIGFPRISIKAEILRARRFTHNDNRHQLLACWQLRQRLLGIQPKRLHRNVSIFDDVRNILDRAGDRGARHQLLHDIGSMLAEHG